MALRRTILALSLLILAVGCDKKPDATPEAPVTTATAGGTAAATGTAPAATVTVAKDTAPTPGVAAVADAGVLVQGNGKTVEMRLGDGGTDLNLKNQKGTGSVTTGSGGTTVTGKSGKSITIPGMGQ